MKPSTLEALCFLHSAAKELQVAKTGSKLDWPWDCVPFLTDRRSGYCYLEENMQVGLLSWKIGGRDLIIQGGPKYQRHTVQLSLMQEYALGVMDNYVMFRLIQRE